MTLVRLLTTPKRCLLVLSGYSNTIASFLWGGPHLSGEQIPLESVRTLLQPRLWSGPDFPLLEDGAPRVGRGNSRISYGNLCRVLHYCLSKEGHPENTYLSWNNSNPLNYYKQSQSITLSRFVSQSVSLSISIWSMYPLSGLRWSNFLPRSTFFRGKSMENY